MENFTAPLIAIARGGDNQVVRGPSVRFLIEISRSILFIAQP
jgi:hypothetical protein